MDSLTYLELFYLGLFTCGLSLVVILGVVGFTVFILDRHIRTCPECGRRRTAYILNTETVKSNPHFDYKGNRPMRIQKISVIDEYQCEHCGHQWTRTSNRTERTPHKPLPESE